LKWAPGLKLATRGGTASRGAQRLHHGFVIAQVALAFVLLSGAGLLGVSLKRALETPVGFSVDHLLTGRIAFPWSGYTNQPLRMAFVERLLRYCYVRSLIPTPDNWFGCPSGDPIGRVDRFHIQISPIGGISNRFLKDLEFTLGTILPSPARASLSG